MASFQVSSSPPSMGLPFVTSVQWHGIPSEYLSDHYPIFKLRGTNIQLCLMTQHLQKSLICLNAHYSVTVSEFCQRI
jgi:hypothetical protein